MSSGHRLSASPGAFADIQESRLQNHCVNQSNESRMNDCIGILYSDSEFMDLSGSLHVAGTMLVVAGYYYSNSTVVLLFIVGTEAPDPKPGRGGGGRGARCVHAHSGRLRAAAMHACMHEKSPHM